MIFLWSFRKIKYLGKNENYIQAWGYNCLKITFKHEDYNCFKTGYQRIKKSLLSKVKQSQKYIVWHLSFVFLYGCKLLMNNIIILWLHFSKVCDNDHL
jgi:hypothetical protein